jgi:hypothetical protein
MPSKNDNLTLNGALLMLNLGGNPKLDLVGFSDSSHADCPNTAHSTMGYCFSIGGTSVTHCQLTISAQVYYMTKSLV